MTRVHSIADVTAFPLQWPDGWVRTKPRFRRSNYSWKGTFGVYRGDLGALCAAGLIDARAGENGVLRFTPRAKAAIA